jgi:hypothetical protein
MATLSCEVVAKELIGADDDRPYRVNCSLVTVTDPVLPTLVPTLDGLSHKLRNVRRRENLLPGKSGPKFVRERRRRYFDALRERRPFPSEIAVANKGSDPSSVEWEQVSAKRRIALAS